MANDLFGGVPSSLRQRPLEETIELAHPIARRMGVSRVVDITRLDRIGIPVAASIRPTAAKFHLCVNAGKGLTLPEAIAGALLEAIEFAYAEPGASELTREIVSLGDVVSSFPQPFDIRSLCPLWNAELRYDVLVAAIRAEHPDTGSDVLLPAELIWMPTCDLPHTGIFGGSTSGLASGNSVLEASVHGLAELIERDTTAMNCICSRSKLLDLTKIPEHLGELVDRIKSAGLDIYIRYTAALGDLPYFEAYIVEPVLTEPIAIAAGYGLHLNKTIALTRAITEAAQARLSHIHGGRDDIVRRHQMFAKLGPVAEAVANERLRMRVADGHETVYFESIDERASCCDDLFTAWETLNSIVKDAGLSTPLVLRLTPEALPLQVVRVIAPGLEQFDAEAHRVGPRLLRMVASNG
jgi:ribosomal protein S12 methylthiotransferase accessory factor